MNPRGMFLAILMALLLVAQPSDLLAKKKRKKRVPKTKLQGKYLWTATQEVGTLEAEFTPAGGNRWRVKFFYTYGNRLGSYDGTAEGSLSEGRLSGTVRTDTVGHTFNFSGIFKDGILEGTHQLVTAKQARDSDILILYPKGRKPPRSP